MRDVFIVTDECYSFDDLISDLKIYPNLVVDKDVQSICIELAHCFLEIIRSDEISQYYDKNEMEKILSVVKKPHYWTIHFKDIESVKELIVESLNKDDVVIDNDTGSLISGAEFASLCHSKPYWDWSKDLT